MIARERHRHHRPHARFAVHRNHPVGDGADGQDGGLRRHDDRREGVDLEHAEVADSKGRFRNIGRLEPSCPCALRQIAPADRDVGNVRTIGPRDHGGDHRVFDRHGQGDVHVVMRDDPFGRPARVESSVFRERARHDRDEQIGVRDLHAMRSFDRRQHPFARCAESTCIDITRDKKMRNGRPALRCPRSHQARGRRHC